MGKYNGAVITTAGQNFFAAAIAGGRAVTFTTMVSSSYAYPATAELQSLTSLQDVVQTVDISYAGVYNNNVVQVSARFDNTNVLSDYLINTLGLYAQVGSDSPVLVAVVTAVTPDQMPAEDPESPSAFIYNVQMIIDNASQIQVTVNPAGTVNVDQLSQYIEKAGGDAADAVIGSATASTASYPVPAAGDSFKVILGKVAKFFSDIKSAITGLSVSGKTVTYTRADGTTGTITTQDTTYSVVSKTANGLAPQLPNETTTTKYLRQDGSWQVPPNTTYSLASTDANGLLKKLNSSNQNTYFMRGDGNWGAIQNNLTTSGGGYVLDARQGRALLQNHINDYVISYSKELSGQSIPANSAKEVTVSGITIDANYAILHVTGVYSSDSNVVCTNNYGDSPGKKIVGVMRNLTSTAKTITVYAKYIVRRSNT